MAAKILEIIGLEKKYKDRFNKDRFKLDIDYLFLEENKILVVIGPNGAGKSTLIRLINLLEKPDCGSIIFDGVEIYKDGYGRSYQAGVERNYKDCFEDGYTDRTEDCVKDGFKHGWKSHPVKVFSSGFLGKIVNEVEVRRKMAVVFQEPLLFNASVYDNIVMGLKIRGKKIPQVKDRLQYLVERLRISHLLSRSARTLSGGEQQRVSLARALILEPRLLLLDEPLANIDQSSRESLRQDLFGLLRGEKRSTIYVTHDRNEAMMLADWVAVMNGGMVEQLGPKDEIFARPKNEFVAQFVGVETLVEGIVLDSKGNVSVVEIEAKNQNAILDNINDNSRINNSKIFIVGNLRRGSKVTLAIRPEDVVIHSTWAVSKYRVSSGSSSGGRSLDESSLGGDEEVVLEYLEYSLKDSFFKLTSTMNIFSGRISEIKDLGIFKKIEVDCGSFTLASFVTRNSIDRLKLEVGKPVFASVKASSIHFFEK